MSENIERNIVNLEDYGHTRSTPSNGPGCQALRDAQKLALLRLGHLLEHMMDKVDDALFARAEKAESNVIQTQYFDAMREMRLIRKDMEDEFADRITENFIKGIPRNTSSSSSFSFNWEDDDPSLGLVNEDDLEEDLAVTNMVNKIRGGCSQSLYALDKRIGFLIGDADLERWQNPMGPEALCDAFRQAARRIETGLEIRLVVFKLFDQYVVTHLDAFYKEVNQRLIKSGVLPEIKTVIRKTSYAAPNVTPGVPPYGSPLETASGPDIAPMAGFGPGSIQSVAYLPGDIGGLSVLQREIFQGEATDRADLSAGDLISGQVNILHSIRNSTRDAASGNRGDSTIGMVAMLFDYILDDANIPHNLRALLGRLQIPVLKVALLDDGFFSRKSHPARQLLNRLATAAVRCDDQADSRDPLYAKIESIVQIVLERFEDNINLFGTLLEDFERFLEDMEQQAQARAERSVKIMEGQERLEEAKFTTLDEIEPRINNQVDVEFVREFIQRHWKNLLFLCCVRDGKNSESWKQAVATMDELIWSIKPKRTPEDRQRLVSIQPKLLESLRRGMERLSIPATERDNFIARLVGVHGRTATNKPVEEPKAAPTEQRETETRPEPSAEQRAASVAKRRSEQNVDDSHSAKVRQLATGVWVEFHNSDGKSRRAKLSWISPITGSYLFTDRQGLKAGNYTMQELAELSRGGRLTILQSAQRFDRAVNDLLTEYHPQH